MYDAYAMQHAVMHGCYACAYDAPIHVHTMHLCGTYGRSYSIAFIRHRVHTTGTVQASLWQFGGGPPAPGDLTPE